MYTDGQKSICKACGEPIEYSARDGYWIHLHSNPRHMAEPETLPHTQDEPAQKDVCLKCGQPIFLSRELKYWIHLDGSRPAHTALPKNVAYQALEAKQAEEAKQAKPVKSFVFSWQGGRTPALVIFPNGQVREVKYMQDGVVLFKRGGPASYERLSNNSARIIPMADFDDLVVGLIDYASKQGNHDE